MKNILLWMIVLTGLTGCIKDKGCIPVAPASEEQRILTFAAANSITVTKHSSGIYYEVMHPGWGATPTMQSEVTVGYVGKFLDGTTFDQNNSITNHLIKFIEGWQIGLRLIQKGGSIRLILPSAYAYGCTSYANIPHNAVLYYEIDLIDVQ